MLMFAAHYDAPGNSDGKEGDLALGLAVEQQPLQLARHCPATKGVSLKGVSSMVTHSYLRLTDKNPRSINLLDHYASCSSVGVTCHGAA